MIELNATLALVAGTNGKATGEAATPEMKQAFDAVLAQAAQMEGARGEPLQAASRPTSGAVQGHGAFKIMYSKQDIATSFVSAPDLLGVRTRVVSEMKLDIEEPAPETTGSGVEMRAVNALKGGTQPYITGNDMTIAEDILVKDVSETSELSVAEHQMPMHDTARIAVGPLDMSALGASIDAVPAASSGVGSEHEPRMEERTKVADVKAVSVSHLAGSKSQQMLLAQVGSPSMIDDAKLQMMPGNLSPNLTGSFASPTHFKQQGSSIVDTVLVSKERPIIQSSKAVQNSASDAPPVSLGASSDERVTTDKRYALEGNRSVQTQQMAVPVASISPESLKGSTLRTGVMEPQGVVTRETALKSLSPSMAQADVPSQSKAILPQKGAEQRAPMFQPTPSQLSPQDTVPKDPRVQSALAQVNSAPSEISSQKAAVPAPELVVHAGRDIYSKGRVAGDEIRKVPKGAALPPERNAPPQTPETRVKAGAEPEVPSLGSKGLHESLPFAGLPRDVSPREMGRFQQSPVAAAADRATFTSSAMSSSGPSQTSGTVRPELGAKRGSESQRIAGDDLSTTVSETNADTIYDVREVASHSSASVVPTAGSMPLAVAQFAPIMDHELKKVGSIETDALLAAQTSIETLTASPRSADPLARTPVPLVPQEVLKIAEQLRAGIRMDRYPLEIALDPPELGQVRMVLQTGEATTTLLIIADRPETADLMRRNASFLHEAFAQEGKGGLDLQFGTSADAERGASQDGSSSQSESRQSVGPTTRQPIPEPQPSTLSLDRHTHASPSSGLNLTF